MQRIRENQTHKELTVKLTDKTFKISITNMLKVLLHKMNNGWIEKKFQVIQTCEKKKKESNRNS